MNIIYSNVNDVKNSYKLPHIVEMLKLSNFLVQKHGYKTTFYGDQESINIFKDIPFHYVYELKDPRIKEIPKELWSIGKFFAILQTNEPFLHIDNDIFIFKKLDENYLNKNILYFHNEHYFDNIVNAYQNHFSLQPKNGEFFKNTSYNCAIFGGQNIEIIKLICNEIINFILDYKDQINSILENKDKKFDLDSKNNSLFSITALPAMLVEQIWIFKLLQYYKQEFKPLLNGTTLKELNKDAYIKNICHVQGDKKNPIIINTLIRMNKYLNI